METNDSPAYEWELSKENVQPLKTGRKFSNLTAALCPNSADRHGKIKEEKQRFEYELRTYSGDDPLSVWYEYVLWMEQNYPTGGRSQVSQLLEKCVAKYKDEEKYKNDPRYLEIWIKFARMCTDPLEIYSFMFNQALCSGLAAFYEAWASELESVGNTKRADTIYRQGLQQSAQPADWLMHRHRDFQSRVAHRLATGEETAMEVGQQEQDAENRGSLSVIRGHGRNKKVGSTRTPSSKPAVLDTARNTVNRPTSNVQGPGFTIFEEKDPRPTTSLPPQTKQWSSVPIRSQVNRENELKPGRWTEAKVRQRAGFNVATPAAPAFQIHEDENNSQPEITPRKVHPDVNQVLSARKPAKPHDPLQALTVVPGESKQVAMYCKHLVYVGAEEFSLEEIRAASLYKKEELRKQKQLEEERQRMEEELRAQREQLATVMEQKKQMQQEVQQYRSSSMMEVGEPQAADAVPTSLPAGNMSEHESSASDSMSTQRLLAFRLSSGSINEAGSCSLSERSAFKSRTPDLSSHSGQQPGIPTPNNKATSRNGSLTAPSPTVNTKDAMRLVMGLFNQSIHTDRDASSSCSRPAQSVSDTRPAAAQFTIFEDEPQKPSKGTEVEEDEDLENRPPTGYQNGPRRRDLAGILQPSKDVPFEPSEDPMDEGEDGDILAQPLQDEPMDCMDGGAEFGDLTFAPYCSSTRNFTGLAKLAAATFSDTVDDRSARRQSLAPATVDMSNVSARRSSQSSSSTLHAQSTAQSESVSSENRTIGEKTRTDGFGISNLSTITERSDDDPKMAATTLPTKEASQLQPHISTVGTTKDTSLQLRLETSSFVHPTANPQSSLLTPSDSSVRTDTSRQQSMTPMNQTCHEIDVSHYVPSDDAADLLSQSVMVNPDHDPFDAELISEFLAKLERPIELYPAYHSVDGPLPVFRIRKQVALGNKCYDVVQRLGEGAYAKVYEIRRDRTEDPSSKSKVVKVQSPACPWEFYITCELNKRLKQQGRSLGSAVMTIDEAYIHSDGSCFVSELLPHGTLLDVINTVRVAGQTLPEPLAVLLAIHILRILQSLMAANIIHGDIKPDNFLFRGFPLIPEGSCDVPAEPSLQLIDFGRSIDMKMFPRGTTFSVGVETSGFQCIEMTTGRPWTYQTDMFGVVGTMNVIIFGTYMKVGLKNGRWKPNSNFKRWFKSQKAMSAVFDELLNVPSCEQLPDVGPLLSRLEDDFRRLHAAKYNGAARSFMAGL